MNDKTTVTVIAATTEECHEIGAMLEGQSYEVTESLIGADGSIRLGDAATDLRIVCLPADFDAVSTNGAYAAPSSNRATVYIATNPTGAVRGWAFGHGASELVARPVSPADLRFYAQRALQADPRIVEQNGGPELQIEFLRRMLDQGVESIEPVAHPEMPSGYFYPNVAELLGRTPRDIDFLESLAEAGVVSRSLASRVRLCAKCREVALNYREVCPACECQDFTESEVVHHFPCGHVGPIESFQQGSELVCPKCSKPARHIGLDYEKPASRHLCRQCSDVFVTPKVEVQCLRCGSVCGVNETVARTLYRYELTPLAREAVERGQLGGLDLEAALKSHQTGLYTKPFFMRQVQHEFDRSKRTSKPFCLMLVRLDGFDSLRSSDPIRATEWAGELYAAMSRDLRTLDVTCVWDANVLAVLLPETPEQGAEVVAQRLHERIEGLDHLLSTQQPRITVGLEQWTEEVDDIEALVARTQKDLDT